MEKTSNQKSISYKLFKLINLNLALPIVGSVFFTN